MALMNYNYSESTTSAISNSLDTSRYSVKNTADAFDELKERVRALEEAIGKKQSNEVEWVRIY